MSLDPRAVHAQLWTFHALSTDLAAGEGLPIGMRRLSSVGVSKTVVRALLTCRPHQLRHHQRMLRKLWQHFHRTPRANSFRRNPSVR